MLTRLVGATVVVAVLAGCAGQPPVSPTTAPTSAFTSASAPASPWQQVRLPGVRPAALALSGDQLLVGGRATGVAAPRLLRVAGDRVTGEVRTIPADPNAEAADLVRLTAADGRIHAIGSMVAGAHSNPRLTVWDGTVGAGIRSRPQEFFTFGGHDAGPLLGTVVVGGRPVIFGSRVGASGPYGLLWTRTGHTWRQQEGPRELASSPDREFGFSGLARSGDRLVVAGDELGLAGGLTQRPVVFVGTVSGGWREVALPVPASPAPVAGQLSRATSVGCPPAGGTCWVTGWVRGHVLAWPLEVPVAPDAPSAGEAVLLPGSPPPGNDPRALVVLAGDRPVVFTNAPDASVQLACPDGWRDVPAPPAPVTAAIATAGGLYAVAGEGLWRLAVPPC